MQGRVSHLVIGILIALFLVHRYFFHVDVANSCVIRIQASLFEFSNLTVKRAIQALKHASPADYKDLCNHVDVVNPNIACGGFGGGCFNPHWSGNRDGRKIDISTANGALDVTMAVIVHEVCHAKQFHEKRTMSEPECYAEDDRLLRSVVQYQ